MSCAQRASTARCAAALEGHWLRSPRRTRRARGATVPAGRGHAGCLVQDHRFGFSLTFSDDAEPPRLVSGVSCHDCFERKPVLCSPTRCRANDRIGRNLRLASGSSAAGTRPPSATSPTSCRLRLTRALPCAAGISRRPVRFSRKFPRRQTRLLLRYRKGPFLSMPEATSLERLLRRFLFC